MKKSIMFFIFIIAFLSYAQSNGEKPLDSLCTAEIEIKLNDLNKQRDDVVKTSIKLRSQLKVVSSFKFARTDIQKQQELQEMNARIKSNQDRYATLTKQIDALKELK